MRGKQDDANEHRAQSPPPAWGSSLGAGTTLSDLSSRKANPLLPSPQPQGIRPFRSDPFITDIPLPVLWLSPH